VNIDERLPEEYGKCPVELTAILREAWSTAAASKDKREEPSAVTLAQQSLPYLQIDNQLLEHSLR
jgi:hypothetical protein